MSKSICTVSKVIKLSKNMLEPIVLLLLFE